MEAMWSIQSLDLSDRGNQFVRFMKEGAKGKVRSYHALARGLLAVLLAMGASNVGATPMLDQIYFDPETNVFANGSFATTISDAHRRLRLVWPVSSITWT